MNGPLGGSSASDPEQDLTDIADAVRAADDAVNIEPIRWEDETGRARWQPRCGRTVRAKREYVGDILWPGARTTRRPVLCRTPLVARWRGRWERWRRRRVFRPV